VLVAARLLSTSRSRSIHSRPSVEPDPFENGNWKKIQRPGADFAHIALVAAFVAGFRPVVLLTRISRVVAVRHHWCRRPAELAGATRAAERRWHRAMAMSAERHRALEILAGSSLGCTEATLLASAPLRVIAHELVAVIKGNVSIDWWSPQPHAEHPSRDTAAIELSPGLCPRTRPWPLPRD
jgi:hypothetical protein